MPAGRLPLSSLYPEIACEVVRIWELVIISQVTEEYVCEGYAHILQHKEIPAYVTIFRVHGPFLFGATDRIDEIV